MEGKDQPVCWAVGLRELELCAQQFLHWSSISTPGVFWCLNSAGVWSWAGSTDSPQGRTYCDISLAHSYIKYCDLLKLSVVFWILGFWGEK